VCDWVRFDWYGGKFYAKDISAFEFDKMVRALQSYRTRRILDLLDERVIVDGMMKLY